MIRNGKDIGITTQVCIIGSGPAGITAALCLQKQGKKVILIEGSRDYRTEGLEASWADKVLLYNGVACGLFASNECKFLIRPYDGNDGPPWERERMFGGTSTHWGCQCRPLDPITFENKRPGFPGWPITRADLDPYYKQAAAFCQLDGDFTAEYWAGILKAEVPHLEGFDTEMYQFIDYNRRNFATRQFDGITIGEGENAVDVILNASLLDINHSNGVVKSLTVASMDDQTPPRRATMFTINADVYVLACGAVANARQLLLSNAGNEHDQVGRYFMCHPLSTDTVINLSPDFLKGPRARLMRGEKSDGARWSDKNRVEVSGRFSPNAVAQTNLGIGSCWFFVESGGYYFEMAPNRDNRVTLTNTLDKVFGQRETKITWKLTQFDENTYKQTTQMFRTAVNKLGGEVSFEPWDSIKFVVNGHHIGTTRMSSKPEEGVVDANLKVHSLKNLYVAGSSVFPTAGISNPTFTIVALSIRLAEHLGKALSS
jgi:choline dehydrogenase-like flavoprotein